MMICKEISNCDFYFDEPIRIEKIFRSQWFHYFRNVTNVYYLEILPKFVNKIEFCKNLKKPIKRKIPSSIYHLVLERSFYFKKDRFPDTITHLTLKKLHK